MATFFWGWTFPVVKEAIVIMPVFAFLTVRFALAALLMTVANGKPARGLYKKGTLLGVLLFLSFAFQTLGLEQTSAANCAFITGLNVLWVAICSSPTRRTWLAVALGVCGLWLLAAPSKEAGVNIGDVLTLLCSFFIAAHILVLNKLDKNSCSMGLAQIQFIVVALLSFATSLFAEDRFLPQQWTGELVFALLITVLGATIFSFWAQTHYQRYTTAVRAALIFIMEPVFAALFAVLFYQEELPATAAVGALLVFLAMVATVHKVRKKIA
ncbi:MAG: DMT family transporter [Proteobacteria bacterium]|nr:DMT family transporter [Pseudomonadota bacterium]